MGAEPLVKCVSPWSVLIYIAYTLLSVLAMMNVLTAFFVETAVKAGVEDKRRHMVNNMWNVFEKKSGTEEDFSITEGEFNARMDDDRMKAYLREVELEAEDMKDAHFFQLIDKDSSGSVDLPELIAGCVRLTATARAVDIAALGWEIDQERQAQEEFRQRVTVALGNLMPQ